MTTNASGSDEGTEVKWWERILRVGLDAHSEMGSSPPGGGERNDALPEREAPEPTNRDIEPYLLNAGGIRITQSQGVGLALGVLAILGVMSLSR